MQLASILGDNRYGTQRERGCPVPLSEHEQRILDEMERSLRGDQGVEVPSDPVVRKSSPGSARRYTIAIVGTLIGLVLVVLGAAQSNVILGIVGFVGMLAAMIYGFGRPTSTEPADGSADKTSSSLPSGSHSATQQSWNERIQDRWERRRRGEL